MNNVYLISRDFLVSLAAKIRELTGTNSQMAPSSMLVALNSISTEASSGIELTGLKDEISYELPNSENDGKIYFQPPIVTKLSAIAESDWDEETDQPIVCIHGIPTKDIKKISLPLCTRLDDQDSLTDFFTNGALEELDLPALTAVSGGEFSNCASLVDVNLPSCTVVPSSSFSGCSSLEEISLPVCTSVGEYAFQDCSGLETIQLPSCLTVGSMAFSGTALETLSLPALSSFYADEYSTNPFEGASSLTTLALASLSELPENAFSNYTGLESISLPTCSHIGYTAFSGCHGLVSITLSTACLLDLDVFEDVLDPDNKIFKMYFVADPNGIIRGTQSGNSLFAETDASEDSSYSSESGSGDENDIISSEAIPGLEIYVPGDLVERFKTEWCGGRYAENVLSMPDGP